MLKYVAIYNTYYFSSYVMGNYNLQKKIFNINFAVKV